MKLNTIPRTVVDADTTRWYREIAQQVNAISEGRLAGFYTASSAAPTTGTWARGDEIYNSEPSELGSASSKYVIDKWKCVTGGSPGTWVQMRSFTGN